MIHRIPVEQEGKELVEMKDKNLLIETRVDRNQMRERGNLAQNLRERKEEVVLKIGRKRLERDQVGVLRITVQRDLDQEVKRKQRGMTFIINQIIINLHTKTHV